jgi:tRNA-Thr(GGU) m(6)t(6)A37 methyltransferase TsaA
MNCSEIILKPIGIIHTPFKSIDDHVPIQGALSPDTEGKVVVFPEYAGGLKDLDGFSHIFLIYYFHKSKAVKLRARPYMEQTVRGMFSIRSPHRPNHIGLTVVQLLSVDNNMLQVKGLDMIDNTPLIDIKPYNPYFDAPSNVRIGWMESHFDDEKRKKNITVKSEKEWLHE